MLLLGLLAGALRLSPAAPSACTLIADSSGTLLLEEGNCATATTPASTFKVALCLIGADAGLLTGPHAPSWPYRDSFPAALPSHRAATDPARWMTESVVWYSQELTRSLGMPRFRAYVDSFGYGNRDLRGDGKGNGLVQAWLSSSLEVTPRQQLEFLAKVRGRRLHLGPQAYALLDSVMPRTFGPEGWTVAGKTGSGAPKDSAGKPLPGRSVGWYVGWLEHGGKAPLLFVHREIDLAPPGSFGGPSARQSFLAALPRRLVQLGNKAKP